MKFQYVEATRAVQNWISSRKLLPGMRLPSARLLAQEIGFSKEATGRACLVLISKGQLIRAGYKLIIANPAQAKAPIEGTIYLVSYADQVLRILERILSDRGVKFKSVKIASLDKGPLLSSLRNVLAEKPDGIILWLPFWIEDLEKILEPEKIPIVLCTNGVPLHISLNLCEVDLYRGTEKALRHLMDLGHRQIAFIGVDNDFHREIANCYRTICLQWDLKSAASNVWLIKINDPKLNSDSLKEQLKNHPEVTAIYYVSDKGFPIQTDWKSKRFAFVGWTPLKTGSKVKPTTLELPRDGQLMFLWACTQMISLIQASESGRPPCLPQRAGFIPNLIISSSNRALTSKQHADRIAPQKTIPSHSLSSHLESRREVYPPLKEEGNYWRHIDLSKLANHSMTKKNGWLGEEPLLHFHHGLHSIHGVPFKVMDPTLHNGRSVITFRSPHSHSTQGRKLPTMVKFPIQRCIKALYFLHGCGWTQWQEPFAQYIMHFKNGKNATVPLIPRGVLRKTAKKRSALFQPNLQDWWPHSEPVNYPHANYAVVFNPADPMEYERHLYTLEWINPCPTEEVSFVEVRVDPLAGPALAVIAVTALF